jgi:hypothetical protein
MSLNTIRDALLDALEAISPSITTFRGNIVGQPAQAVPYQRATVLFARPDNAEIAASHTEQGIMQALLFYPMGAGEDDAQARADLIRAAFPFRASIGGALKINITGTAEVLSGFEDLKAARWVVPVRVPFSAYVAD